MALTAGARAVKRAFRYSVRREIPVCRARSAGEREKALPRFAYLPFGAGPHICLGNHFALMEAHLVLATLLQAILATPAPGTSHVAPK